MAPQHAQFRIVLVRHFPTAQRAQALKFKRQQFLTFAISPAIADRLHAFTGGSTKTGSAQLEASSERHVDQFFDAENSDGKQRSKLLRIRQEIGSGRCFADLKTLKNTSTKLHRSLISRMEVESLLRAPDNSAVRPEVWKINKQSSLSASTEVHYHRNTFTLASSSDGATRLTVDHGICCRWLSDRSLPDYYDLASTCLLTMKFTDALPAVFKRIVYEFRLQPQRTWLAQLCGETLAAAPHTVSPFHSPQPSASQPLKLNANGEKSVA